MPWWRVFRSCVTTAAPSFWRRGSGDRSVQHLRRPLIGGLDSMFSSSRCPVASPSAVDRCQRRSHFFQSCMVDTLHSTRTSRHFSGQGWIDPPAGTVLEVPLAQTGEGIAECELLKWFVHEGENVDEFQRLCEVQSDKATIEITSRYKGKIHQLLFLPGDVVKVGETLLKIFVEEIEGAAPNSENLERESISQVPLLDEEMTTGVVTTPAVRHLAKKYGLDINEIKGTGKDGRVLKEDVINYASSRGEENGEEKVTTDGDKIVHLTGFQRAMVKSMTMAAKIPHFHYVEEINFDALVKLKLGFQEANTDSHIKHTYLPFLVKSLSMALEWHPVLNSSFIEDSNELVLKGSHNIGVAVATPHGLAVPNVKKVQSLSILEITRELMRLQGLAAENKLHAEDISGGTLTLSNIGSIGGTFGSPLINSPEVAIIALGRIRKLPRFRADGSVYPAAVGNVVVGADHRVVDGATVARFCNDWKALIEKPDSLLLRLK